jgi:hypothetical protein
MTGWTEVKHDFIKADVIRWNEGDWLRRGPRGRTHNVKVGDRVVTAEVLQPADADGWVLLKVVACAVGVSRVHRKVVTALKEGTEIRRAYKNIVNGKPERLLWSDEHVRAMLSSKFLGNKEHERFMAMETDEVEAKPARSKQKTGRKPRAPKRLRPRAD